MPHASLSHPGSMHVEVHGQEGDPVVLVHGFGASGFFWRKWVPAIAERHRTLVVDLKGSGRAPKPRDGRYGPLDQARLLSDWIVESDLEGATLVGHSLGGAVVLLAILLLEDRREGHRVRRLVLVSGAVYPQDFPLFVGILRIPLAGRLLLAAVPPRAVVRLALKRICHPPVEIEPGQVEGYARPFADPGAKLAALESARQILTEDPEPWLARYHEIRTPTLLIWGENDPVVPPANGRRLHEELPDSELVLIPECGHLPPEEHPEASLAPVMEFLSTSPGSDGRP